LLKLLPERRIICEIAIHVCRVIKTTTHMAKSVIQRLSELIEYQQYSPGRKSRGHILGATSAKKQS
jgi:hypothetical protein